MQTSSKTLALKLTKTPSDGSGTFEALVAGWEIDHDGERFDRKAFDSVDPEKPYPLHYHHMPSAADPGATIGMVFAKVTDAGLRVIGQLDLKNPMGVAVYERMLLPASDPQALHEFSVGFEFDPAKTYKGDKGETVIPEAKLREVSVVYRGAQKTELISIKSGGRTMTGAEALVEIEAALNGKKPPAPDPPAPDPPAPEPPAPKKTRKLTTTGQIAVLKSRVDSFGGGLPRTLAPPASTVQGNALEMFASMKRDLIKTFPEMAKSVFGELTAEEQAAVRQKKLREKGEDLALYGVMR
jgi:HK97 family phage prohead protease